MESIATAYTESNNIPRHWTLSSVKGTLVVDRKYMEGLKDMQAGQRIVVIFYFHLSPEFKPRHLVQKPPHRKEKKGVFSTCSPYRPNPIGMSVLKVLDVKENVIEVRGMDMLDGTPVLDIKPYVENKQQFQRW
ncbi:MAG: tRNA (N6-threonylcarbamoyladenosine(37)-N6)-methyltransferase TrmO [Thermodesulfobacteriota bacterium]|nr:tRNA (N6-threonylcarbamoyladenosine(37)-N6)-methyltransferase TrmO [Thermodesulfobacteriota bacterium]